MTSTAKFAAAPGIDAPSESEVGALLPLTAVAANASACRAPGREHTLGAGPCRSGGGLPRGTANGGLGGKKEKFLRPSLWASLKPLGIGEGKPDNYRSIVDAVAENRNRNSATMPGGY